MRLEFSRLAQQDMQEIARYLRQNFPNKGLPTRKQIVQTCEMLLTHPLQGRAGSEPETREYLMPHLPYRLIYQFTAEQMTILRVYHTSRKPLTE